MKSFWFSILHAQKGQKRLFLESFLLNFSKGKFKTQKDTIIYFQFSYFLVPICPCSGISSWRDDSFFVALEEPCGHYCFAWAVPSAQLSRPQHLGNKGRRETGEERPLATTGAAAADQSVDIAPPQPPRHTTGPPATLLWRRREFPRPIRFTSKSIYKWS